MLWTILVIILLLGALAWFYTNWDRGRTTRPNSVGNRFGREPADLVTGTLTVTGISDRPATADKNGEMFCTLSGTILGPETVPTEVYGTYVVPQAQRWPQIGDDLPVVYRPGKAETTWRVSLPK